MNDILEIIKPYNNILILGFGKEGRSTYRFLTKFFPKLKITISDKDVDVIGDSGIISIQNTQIKTGEDYLTGLEAFDLVIKSPGIRIPENTPENITRKITSQSEIFMQAYAFQTIGITGTKGKSTTSALIHHILYQAGKNTMLVGNIGQPPFDFIDEVEEDTIIVFEFSSLQLENIGIAPHIAILLNLFPEHLDRYDSVGDYFNSKMKILYNQKPGDHFIYNKDSEEITSLMVDLDRHFLCFSNMRIVNDGCFIEKDVIKIISEGNETEFIKVDKDIHLKGRHNQTNIMAAILACKINKVEDNMIIRGIKSFRGLEHRLEYVGTYSGIEFYNDSIATIPEATIQALHTLENVETLILGGFDRDLDYSLLYDELNHSEVRNIIFMGPAGERMNDEFARVKIQKINTEFVISMARAFELIPRITRKGKICLLSPAAASYDSFINFEERGCLFKKIARSL